MVFIITLFVFSYFPERTKKQQFLLVSERIKIVSDITINFLENNDENDNNNLISIASTPLKKNKHITFYFISDTNGKILNQDQINVYYNYNNQNLQLDTTFMTNDEKYIVKVTPIHFEKKIVGYLGLGITLNSVHDYLSQLKTAILFYVIFVMVVGLTLIVIYTKIIFKPLIILNEKIKEISTGNYTVKVDLNYQDEIGELSTNFNKMAENLDLTHKKLKYEITQRQNTEDELLMTQQSLYKSLEKQKELNLLKSRFISMISHEYRTPLTTISNSTYLLEQYSKKGDMQNVMKFSGMINSSVKRMTELLEDVLKVSREDKAKMELSLVEVDFNDFFNDICEEFKLVDHFKHIFEINLSCKTIKIEAKLLQLILRNLISNSIKYSPANSTIRINSTIIENQLIIKIKDNGIGISEKDLENLFVPFHRGENVGAIEGTGLGMAIIKDSVELLLGEISVASKTGEDSFTEFTLSFPLVNNSMMINPNI